MCLDSTGDFFGGYDHRADAGFVHWADHHIAVGKKQWTWGDAPFGHAWDANLADDDAAYIELMAGVYTDNQPDFAHLAPGETKSFSQYWYPLAGTGPVSAAGLDAALAISDSGAGTALRLAATRRLPGATVRVTGADGSSSEVSADLSPDGRFRLETGGRPAAVEVSHDGRTLLHWVGSDRTADTHADPDADTDAVDRARRTGAAVEPPRPEATDTVEQLYLIGRHLHQYRHATRSPEPYWQQALRRDPGHVASHIALAGRRYDQGLFAEAERHLRAAVARLTTYNGNPAEGEAHYRLGLAVLRQGRDAEAYESFAKAAWLRAWVGPAAFQMAVLDARAGRTRAALDRVDQALRAEPEQLQAAALRVLLLRRLGRDAEAEGALGRLRGADPLDVWAWFLDGSPEPRDRSGGLGEAQLLLDVAGEMARTGEHAAGLVLVERARLRDAERPLGQTACATIADYRAAELLDRRGDRDAARAARRRAAAGDRSWAFPSRLDDVAALEAALAAAPQDATAAALLGHWLYANGRPADAISRWQSSLAIDPSDPVVWRNLAVALVNTADDGPAATAAYRRALELAPGDGRLWYETDQLQRRLGAPPAERLQRLGDAPLRSRDDLTVEYAHLLLTADRLDEAVDLLQRRRFQPWEGGEGKVLRVWDRAQVLLAQRSLRAGDPARAVAHVEQALTPPTSLGEARHPLANPAQLLLLAGDAFAAAGDTARAAEYWRRAARTVGDFSGMAPQPYSENTYYSVLAARAIGDGDLAGVLADGLAGHAKRLAETPARVDYFATSLPNLLLFDENPQRGQDLLVGLIRGQLALLADDRDTATRELDGVLTVEPSHEPAHDLRRDLGGRPERRIR